MNDLIDWTSLSDVRFLIDLPTIETAFLIKLRKSLVKLGAKIEDTVNQSIDYAIYNDGDPRLRERCGRSSAVSSPLPSSSALPATGGQHQRPPSRASSRARLIYKLTKPTATSQLPPTCQTVPLSVACEKLKLARPHAPSKVAPKAKLPKTTEPARKRAKPTIQVKQAKHQIKVLANFYVKVEERTGICKPLHREFRIDFPRIHRHNDPPVSPFQSIWSPRSRSRRSRRKRRDKRPEAGYCECCRAHYKHGLDQHRQSDRHRAVYADTRKWEICNNWMKSYSLDASLHRLAAEKRAQSTLPVSSDLHHSLSTVDESDGLGHAAMADDDDDDNADITRDSRDKPFKGDSADKPSASVTHKDMLGQIEVTKQPSSGNGDKVHQDNCADVGSTRQTPRLDSTAHETQPEDQKATAKATLTSAKGEGSLATQPSAYGGDSEHDLDPASSSDGAMMLNDKATPIVSGVTDEPLPKLALDDVVHKAAESDHPDNGDDAIVSHNRQFEDSSGCQEPRTHTNAQVNDVIRPPDILEADKQGLSLNDTIAPTAARAQALNLNSELPSPPEARLQQDQPSPAEALQPRKRRDARRRKLRRRSSSSDCATSDGGGLSMHREDNAPMNVSDGASMQQAVIQDSLMSRDEEGKDSEQNAREKSAGKQPDVVKAATQPSSPAAKPPLSTASPDELFSIKTPPVKTGRAFQRRSSRTTTTKATSTHPSSVLSSTPIKAPVTALPTSKPISTPVVDEFDPSTLESPRRTSKRLQRRRRQPTSKIMDDDDEHAISTPLQPRTAAARRRAKRVETTTHTGGAQTKAPEQPSRKRNKTTRSQAIRTSPRKKSTQARSSIVNELLEHSPAALFEPSSLPTAHATPTQEDASTPIRTPTEASPRPLLESPYRRSPRLALKQQPTLPASLPKSLPTSNTHRPSLATSQKSALTGNIDPVVRRGSHTSGGKRVVRSRAKETSVKTKAKPKRAATVASLLNVKSAVKATPSTQRASKRGKGADEFEFVSPTKKR
eukprot:TRINITY_DN10543_c0_g1_i1.p1 TRINITY_DN10543_c0_g1~~TRINITY_DN10543_c0_g1_i1.p1  ORF type:complete len:1010 (+),score=149.59 TRINITY_DN10543_c0_g1_i1:97-3126(+)